MKTLSDMCKTSASVCLILALVGGQLYADSEDWADVDEEDICFDDEPCYDASEFTDSEDWEVEEDYCATSPPPQGLVKRCRRTDIEVPGTYFEFEGLVREWMSTCVSSGRAPELVDGDPSLAEVWSIVDGRTGLEVGIKPVYEPNSWYASDGRTCYGVAEVSFELERQGDVSMGEPTITFGFSDQDVKDVSRRIAHALESTDEDPAVVRRLKCVASRMGANGKQFDDAYYNVAPTGDLIGNWNAPACYKEGSYGSNGYAYECRDGAAALSTCKRGFLDTLMRKAAEGGSDAELVDWLTYRDDEINRGLVHLRQLQESGSAALSCPGVRTHLMPEIAASGQKSNSVYGCY